MQFALIMQELRRRRVLVGTAFVVSVAIGALLAYQVTPGLPPHLQSRQKLVGQASTRVLVDTPSSLIASLNPNGAASLLGHAQLLGDLLATHPLHQEIAQKAGIPYQALAVVPPTIAAPVGTQVSRAAIPPAAASTITILVDPALPIVTVDVQSPTGELAARLASTAVDELRQYQQTIAQEQGIPASRQPVLRSLGLTSSVAAQGPSKKMAFAVAAILFLAACYLILVVTGVRRRGALAEASGSTIDAGDDSAFAAAPATAATVAAAEEGPSGSVGSTSLIKVRSPSSRNSPSRGRRPTEVLYPDGYRTPTASDEIEDRAEAQGNSPARKVNLR